MDSIDDIQRYYENNDETRRLQLHQLEFALTTAILKEKLRGNSKILELGAGTGAYSSFFLEQGHTVHACELVKKLSDQLAKREAKALSEGRLQITVGDARSVTDQISDSFDAVIIMGPLYHLVEEADRNLVLKKSWERLNNGGLLISAHLSRIGLMSYMLTRFPTWAEEDPQQVDEILQKGFLAQHPRNGQFRGYFANAAEVFKSHENLGQKSIEIFCQDPLISAVDELFNRLPEDLQAAWIKVARKVSQDPQIVGSGRSLLGISKK